MKYIALGDSISAGFISNNPKDLPGKMIIKNSEKKIVGMSFPAFLSWYLNDMDKEIIENFVNYSATGTRVDDWLDFFEGNHTDENKKIFGKDIESLHKEFIKDIKSADHISISLGANEFIKTIFEEAVEFDINKIMDSKFKIREKEYLKLTNKITTSYNKYESKLIDMVKRIKKLNKGVKIYFLGYTLPFNNDDNPLVKKAIDFFGKTNPFYDLFLHTNNAIVNICKNMDIEYVDIESNELWKKNSKWNYSDIDMSHPNISGYKTISQILLDVIMKNEDEKINKTFAAYKKNEEYGIRYKTALEIEMDNTTVKEGVGNRLVTLAGTYAELSVLFTKAFLNITVIRELLPCDKLNEFLFRDENKNFLLIFSELVENKTLLNFFNFFVDHVYKKNDDLLDGMALSEDAEYSLLNLLVKILTIKEFTNPKVADELADIVVSVVNRILETNNKEIVLKLMIKAASSNNINITKNASEQIYKILTTLNESPEGDTVFKLIINEIIEHPNKYKVFNTFDSFIVKVIWNLKQDKKFSKNVSNIVEYMISNSTTQEALSNLVIEYLGEFSDIDSRELKTVITKVVETGLNAFDDFGVWKEIININNNFNLLSNSDISLERAAFKMFYAFIFTSSNKKQFIKTIFLSYILNVINEIHALDYSYKSVIYGISLSVLNKHQKLGESIVKLIGSPKSIETKNKVDNIKIGLLGIKFKKAYRKQISSLYIVAKKENKPEYINILKYVHVLGIIFIASINIKDKTKKLKNKDFNGKLLTIFKLWHNRTISKNSLKHDVATNDIQNFDERINLILAFEDNSMSFNDITKKLIAGINKSN